MVNSYSVNAWFLGTRIDMRELNQASVLALAPLTLSTGPNRWMVVFRFGVVVLFGHNQLEEHECIEKISRYVAGAFPTPEMESAEMVLDPEKPDHINSEGQLVVQDATVDRLQIIAQALAKSVVLAYYEKAVFSTFERFEKLVDQLQHGLSPKNGREVIKEVAQALTILTRTVGKVEVAEKPELTWDNSVLDRYYQRLAMEYELNDRDLVLSRKLDLLWRIAETYLDLLNNRQGHRVEWYVVILIIIEIVLSLFEKLHIFT
jgi:uncharacterized Rmd1/YagE family protein